MNTNTIVVVPFGSGYQAFVNGKAMHVTGKTEEEAIGHLVRMYAPHLGLKVEVRRTPSFQEDVEIP